MCDVMRVVSLRRLRPKIKSFGPCFHSCWLCLLQDATAVLYCCAYSPWLVRLENFEILDCYIYSRAQSNSVVSMNSTPPYPEIDMLRMIPGAIPHARTEWSSICLLCVEVRQKHETADSRAHLLQTQLPVFVVILSTRTTCRHGPWDDRR